MIQPIRVCDSVKTREHDIPGNRVFEGHLIEQVLGIFNLMVFNVTGHHHVPGYEVAGRGVFVKQFSSIVYVVALYVSVDHVVKLCGCNRTHVAGEGTWRPRQ